jgi:cysteine desulfurase
MIYLDNNATTKVAPEVFEAMIPFLKELYANPSSGHTFGREMKRAIERAREQVASLLGAADTNEIAFTSCGTESDNWAIRGALYAQPDKKHIVTTRVEHEAVRALCEHLEKEGYEVTWLDVDGEGLIDLEQLRESLREEDTAVVSVMLAQNETGVLFPVEEIGQIVKEKSNALFHVDGVQAVGKIPIDLKRMEVDLFAISGHKLYAPKGVGAIYVKSGVNLPSYILGASQEMNRRAGTSAVPNIVALGAACELVMNEDHDEVRRLRDKLEDTILEAIPNAHLNGAKDRNKRLPNTANISFAGVEGESVMAHLDQRGIYVSTGSACHSGSHEASPTLKAMNVPYQIAMGSIRFSLGRYNTEEEIDETLRVLPAIVDQLYEMSPYKAVSGAIDKIKKEEKEIHSILSKWASDSLGDKVSAIKTVVSEVKNSAIEISIEEARELAGDEVELGDVLVAPSENLTSD